MKIEPKPLEDWQKDDAERLRRLFDSREPKISQAEFGAKFEIGSQSMIWQYLAGRRPLNIRAVTAFARGLDVNIAEISPTIASQITDAASLATPGVTGQIDAPGVQRVTDDDNLAPVMIPIRMVPEHLQAGITGFETDHLYEDGGHLHVPRQWIEENDLAPNSLRAIKVKGDSMVPTLFSGDIVVVDITDKSRVSGSVFAMNFKGEAIVKRLKYERREWYLSSDNIEHRRESCNTGECDVIGRVVRFEIRNFKDRL